MSSAPDGGPSPMRILFGRGHIYTETLSPDDTHVYMFMYTPPREIMCPICLGVIIDSVITPFGHSFCKNCISRYVLIVWARTAPSFPPPHS